MIWSTMKKLSALIILDGFGHRDETDGNAVVAAGTPFIRSLLNEYPHTFVNASALAVGLPEGQMGNSEVGHLNIGAGRIVYQELTRIIKSISDGDFFDKPEFLHAIENCKVHDSALHLMGLCSDGGVHSMLSHLYALVELAKRHRLSKVFIHCFMDGRDVPPDSGADYIRRVQKKLSEIGCGKIATVSGRFYAMDRDNRFERVEKAYNALANGDGVYATDPVKAIEDSYANGVTDEFILPTVITENGAPVARISRNDSVIFFNYRPDRPREITRAFLFNDFTGFERKNGCYPLRYVTMTQYDKAFDGKLEVAFKPQNLNNTFGEYISTLGLKQLRIAETEKYAHVTFFFNGGVEAPNSGEDRVLIPSPKVETYDLKPEMSAFEVADEAEKRIRSGAYDVIILNFANPDMVGHTGKFDATVKALQAVDACCKKVVKAILDMGGQCIITADHGNCEKMWDANHEPFTAHTTNKVPFILVSNNHKGATLASDGRLCDITPTLLELMGIGKPLEMTGHSLIK